jgi:hypothetical protein
MFRPAAAVNNVQVPGNRPSIGRRAVRAFTRFLLTACIGGAGVAWQFYGDAAKRIMASWAPHLVLTSSPLLQIPAPPPEQPSLPTVQTIDVNAAPTQPAAPAQTAPKGVRTPPPYLQTRRSCSSRWRAISRVWGKRSSSSRPASNKCLAMLPSVPSRTGGPGYQRFRHGWLPRSRVVHVIKLTETRETTPYLWMTRTPRTTL